MRRRSCGTIAAILAAVVAIGCMGCAQKETGTPEGNGSSQEGMPSEGGINSQEGMQTQEGMQSEDDGQTQEGMHSQSAQQDDEEDVPGSERELAVVLVDDLPNGRFPSAEPLNVEDVFAYETWEEEKTQIKNPAGILSVGEELLVCDMGNHCIVRLTADGDFVERYGEHGHESGNFAMPTAILLHENEIYVLDSGNLRIQVFDTDMNYVREILFEGASLRGGRYNDMAIAGDGTIYLSTNTMDPLERQKAGIYYIGEDGRLCIITGWFTGHLEQQDGIVYAADRKRFMYYPEEDHDRRGCSMGENWLYRVERTGIEQVCELPYGYAPADFVVEDDHLYTVSTIYGRLSCISMEGEVTEGIFTEKQLNGDQEIYLCMPDENTLFVTGAEGQIYKGSRMEGE
ncbi:MAG: hypothetical protein NC254_05645 [bacterium]|nr:hypothetical protein [bacterium]